MAWGVCCYDGRYHGNTLYTSCNDLTDGATIHATDSHTAMAREAHHLLYARKAEGGECVSLRRGGIYGRNAYVVYVERIGDQHLIHRLYGKADNLVFAKQCACRLVGHVALPDVYAIGIDGECHIYAVIDDKRYAEGLQGRLQFTSQCYELSCGAILLAQLHHSDATRYGFAHYPIHVTTTCEGSVGDKVKRKVKGRLHTRTAHPQS